MTKNAIGATLKTPVVKVKCRHCLYFDRMATFEDRCSKLGIVPSSEPCTRFTADVFSFFTDREEDAVITKQRKVGTNSVSIIEMLGSLPKAQLQMVSALALAEARSRGRGYSAGEKVYVNLGDVGDPYLNSFAQAVVLHCTKTHVLVRGVRSNFNGFLLYDSSSLLNRSKWKRIRKKLVKDKKINSPGSPRELRIRKSEIGDYESPEIDKVLRIKNRKLQKQMEIKRIRLRG